MAEFKSVFLIRLSSSDLTRHFIWPELFLDVGWVVRETGVEVVSIDHVLFVYDVDGTAREGIRGVRSHSVDRVLIRGVVVGACTSCVLRP